MSEAKRYSIVKLNDILEIPPEKLDNFIVDLRAWYDLQRGIVTAMADLSKKIEGINSIQIQDGMTWIDDDKNDVTMTIHVKAAEAGDPK